MTACLDRKTRKGKDICRVYCVAPHYGPFSVITLCLFKRYKPPPPLHSDRPQFWTSKLCSLFFFFLLNPNVLQKITKTDFFFWLCLVLVKLSIRAEHLCLSVCFLHHLFSVLTTFHTGRSLIPLTLFYSLFSSSPFQTMFRSALWVQVRATGGGGRWRWAGSCARRGPLLSLMNTSKNLMYFLPHVKQK